jgi:hypothetical protein
VEALLRGYRLGGGGGGKDVNSFIFYIFNLSFNANMLCNALIIVLITVRVDA